jgi:hypothetical protein
MVEDGGVARFHFLVAVLTFPGVVVAAIVHPAVYITMPFCDERIGKDQYIWCETRRANSALGSSTVLLMKNFTSNSITRL